MSWLALALELMAADDPPPVVIPNEEVGARNCQISQNTPSDPHFVDFNNFAQGGAHPERPAFAGEHSGPSQHAPRPERADEAGAGPYAPGLVGEWQRNLSLLNRERAPCPLFRSWPTILRAAERFLDDHGQAALAAGWSDLDLFGVHGQVGTIRVDCAGALMLGRGALAVEISADAIRFANGHVYRRVPRPWGVPVVPVWAFGA